MLQFVLLERKREALYIGDGREVVVTLKNISPLLSHCLKSRKRKNLHKFEDFFGYKITSYFSTYMEVYEACEKVERYLKNYK